MIEPRNAVVNRCFGYARVSTDDQNLSLQIDALIRFGVRPEDVFSDKMSGAKAERPELDGGLKQLKHGDTLVVWRLDRLGRSMQHLVTLVERLRADHIGFKSISDGAIDTTTASGELIFNVFSALAQFERRLIQERTKAGLAAARARGKFGGRKRLPADTPRVILAKKLHSDKSIRIEDICKTQRISKTTLYRYLSMADEATTPSRQLDQ